ncbi:MAG: hypothetical protein ACLPID_10780 [Beijerinckiaceae bacterium]
MRVMRIVLSASIALSLIFGAQQSPSSAFEHERSAEAVNVQNVRQCGWFAVFRCFPKRLAAFEYNDEIETGETIETNEQDFPEIKPALFCVVKGPGSYDYAVDLTKTFGGDVKRGCRDLPSK